MISYVKVTDIDQFQSRLHIWDLNWMEFLEWLCAVEITHNHEMFRISMNEASRRVLGKSVFQNSSWRAWQMNSNDVLHSELGREQVRQDFRASVYVRIYGLKNKKYLYFSAVVLNKKWAMRLHERWLVLSARRTIFSKKIENSETIIVQLRWQCCSSFPRFLLLIVFFVRRG